MADEAIIDPEENNKLKERLREAEEILAAIRHGDINALLMRGSQESQPRFLAGAQDHYQPFIERIGEPAVILSKEGFIFYANLSFAEMIGFPQQELLGASFLQFVEKNTQHYFLEGLVNWERKKIEFNLLTKSQQNLTVVAFFSKGCEFERFCLLMTDITQLKRAQQLIAASESIIKILSEAPSLPIALKRLIEILKSALDWEAILVWTWNKEKRNLVCVEHACISELNIDEFVKASKESVVKETQMVSHVWSSYRPFWIEDVAEDLTFLRKEAAKMGNLHGALAFPFYEESHVAGVIELFRRSSFREGLDEPMHNLITTIGIELGLYVQRKIAEETKLQFSTVLAYSASGIFTTDVDGIVKSWNPGAEKIYGWTAKEMVGTSITKTFPPHMLQNYDSIREALLSGKTIERAERQRMHKNGSLIWVEMSYGMINDPFGKMIGACVVVQDISSQKAALESITRSEERFRAFVDVTGDWIWETDKEGNLVFSNPAIYRVLGYQVEEMIGKNLLYFSFVEDREKMENQFKTYAAQKIGWVQQSMRLMHKDSSERWLESNASELLNDRRELQGFRGACRDVTELRNLDKIKNEFISLVSHELRTPLTSIHGALTLLTRRTFSPDEAKELLETAQRNSARLTRIINDIMDVEKLQLGKFEFNFKKVNMRDVILEAIKSSEIIARKLDVKIASVGMSLEAQVKGDYQRLVQVMMNLLSNAIKLSPAHGTIYVMLESLEHSIRVSVSDEGPGIKESFRPKIFERFAQEDSSSKRTYQGTGLGLSICKNIIEGHGGTIQYTTQVGKGTTFFFDLPQYNGLKGG